MNTKKIFLVDDHFVVREGLKLIFETEEEYEVIGEAQDGKEALEKLEQLMPDVILMDLSMPDMSGIDVIRVLKERDVRIPIVILTTFNEDGLIKKGISLGAKGYLLKDCTRNELIRTVEAAIRGEILMQPEISKTLFNTKEEASKTEKADFGITEREFFVLQAIVRGCKSKEIAIDMGISERTVKAYLTNIYNKLNVNSRSEAVAVAIRHGIVHNQKGIY
jgi:NarL family two-component system response regulator YdfI